MRNIQILEEAADWFVTLRDGAGDSDTRARFTTWLCKSPEHVRTYLELTSIWADAACVDPQRRLDVATLMARARGTDNVVPLADTQRATQTRAAELYPGASPRVAAAKNRSAPFRRTARRVLAAACVAALCLVSGVAWWSTYRFPGYATGIGEQRSITLADGSTVELNSRSRIRIRFSEGARVVDLLEGQGQFRVKKDPQRPFIVRSDNVRVRAVGTQFDVYRKSHGTVVTVLEGKVEVRAASPGGLGPLLEPYAVAPALPLPADEAPDSEHARAAAVQVRAGEQVTVADDRIARAPEADIAAATAWTQRQLVFDSARLVDVVQEFNRYNARQLVIGDVRLEDLLISGVFSSTDPASLLRFLREQPEIAVQETDTQIRISRRE